MVPFASAPVHALASPIAMMLAGADSMPRKPTNKPLAEKLRSGVTFVAQISAAAAVTARELTVLNTFAVPRFGRLDLVTAWTTNRLRVQLNLMNALNKRIFEGQDGYFIIPQASRTLLATVSATW